MTEQRGERHRKKMARIPKNKAYAFWKYDLFPFMHGGQVRRITRENGQDYVLTEQYGNSEFAARWFTTEEKGRKLLAHLELLKKLRNTEEAEMKARYCILLNHAFGEAGINRIIVS